VANAEGQFDFVAPSGNAPSSSEILKSKSNAVGGGRKRCSIGKSCSATCIEGVKTCLVELPDVVVGSLIKVRDRIFGVTKPVASTPVQNPPIKNPPTEKNSSPVNKQTQDKEHNLGLFFGQAIQRFRTLIGRINAAKKLKKQPVPKTPKETVARTRPSAPMTAHKHGDIPADKVRKVREVASKLLDKMKRLGPEGTISIDGSEKADKVKWSAVEGSGSRVLGAGGFGAFLKVPTKKLLGYSDGMPNEIGVKVGDISRTEATLIKKLGEVGLGPKLIASRFVKNAHSNMDNGTIHKGMIAMEVVPGVPLYKAPQKINGIDKDDAYNITMGKLHKLGYAHNDAKGDNLIIDDKGVARFVDLGLSQKNWKAALSEALGGWTGTNFAMTNYPTGKQADVLERNFSKVMTEMEKDGLTKSEAKDIATFGIQHSAESFRRGVWEKVSNQNARKYINMYYEGV
jgi:hypothetical protein